MAKLYQHNVWGLKEKFTGQIITGRGQKLQSMLDVLRIQRIAQRGAQLTHGIQIGCPWNLPR